MQLVCASETPLEWELSFATNVIHCATGYFIWTRTWLALYWLQCNIKNITCSATRNAVKNSKLETPFSWELLLVDIENMEEWCNCEEIKLYSEWKKNGVLGFTTGIYPNHWSCSKKDKPWWKCTLFINHWWYDTNGNVETAYLKTLRMIIVSREHGAQLSNGLDKRPKNKLWWLSR